MIDIDDQALAPDILRMRGLLYLCGLTPTSASYERSPSGTGWHVIFQLPKVIPDMHILVLQGILSDDPVRQAFNYHRFSDANMPDSWRPWSNVLFE